jgi:hypothetical protein
MSEPTDNPFESIDDDPGDPGVTADGPLGRLFDGSADGPSVGQLQADYNLPWHWSTALRGCCRVATGRGVPPAFEIVLGSGIGLLAYTRSGSGLDAEPDAETELDPTSWHPNDG